MRFAEISLFLKRAVILAVVLAQLVPANVSLAADSGDFQLVICTPEGQKTVSWSAVSDEPAPFEEPVEHDANADCEACVGCCRLSPTNFAAGTNFPGYASPLSITLAPKHDYAPDIRLTEPPPPSRAPPTLS